MLFNLAKDGIPEIYLNGVINDDRAQLVADELFNTVADKIRIRINSVGGSVYAGYSIISSMQAFRDAGGVIETINMGVADSTAGWILAMGTKGHRIGYIYSKTVVHEPHLADGTKIDDIKDEKLKSEVKTVLNGIVNIISACTGIKKPKLKNLMKAETTFVGKELVENGFVDKINTIKNQIDIPENATSKELMEIVNNTNIIEVEPKKENVMKEQLADLFNLSKEASDNAFVEAAKAVVNSNTTLKEANKGLTSKNNDQKTEIDNLTEKVKGFEVSENETYIENAVKRLQLTDEKKTELETMVKNSGFETVKAVIELMPEPTGKKSPDIENKIEEGGSVAGNTDTKIQLENAKKYFDNMSDDTHKADYEAVCDTEAFQNLIIKK